MTEPKDRIAAEPETGPPSPGPTVAGALVVVVEDEDGVRALVRRIILRAGFRVLDFASPTAALATLTADRAAHEIDLLLTDVVMPEISGVELAEKFLEVRPDTPVLFMSGYAPEDVVHSGLLDDRRRFLAKPFTPAELIGVVSELLRAR